ncbi:ubiquinol-cytochrome C chaperone family protein [Parvibaculum sp.]|uniref:ubiquinol-cytochrome C chaperone family protein n=1 Tax=Parvibaculum sp. TaxID=2024848 RepID=UPI00320CD639
MIWKRIFGRPDRDEVPFGLYRGLVGQARMPGFYLHSGVPDTVEGRFEMVALHVFLVLRRLRAAGDPARELAQRVFDIMFDDMDQTLREMGVSDLSVGKKIKGLASAFYGRMAAYDAGLDAEGDAQLQDALRRNVFAGLEPTPVDVAALALYVRNCVAALGRQSDEDLLAGRLSFADVPAASTESKTA